MDQVVCRENYGSSPIRKTFVKTQQQELQILQRTERWTSISQVFRSIFLPQGYPESVSDDYLPYQVWDTVQAFCSSITGTLATKAVLQGVGVGDDNATVMAATITWLMKDGTGMVGRIVFAWMKGSYLDCDCKRWRLFADILNDAAILLDICAPIFQTYFRLIVCASGVMRSIVGVAGGATRAALTQHQARRNNMADVSAKDGSQETLVNLAALICSLLLIPVVSGHDWLTWTLFFVFTALHLLANYSAVTSVSMEMFNLASYDDLVQLVTIYSGTNYLLKSNLKKGTVNIAFHREVTATDMLEAAFQSEVIEYALSQVSKPVIQTSLSKDTVLLHKVVEAAAHIDNLSMLKMSQEFTRTVFPRFLELCEESGWKTSHALFCVDEWRALWGPEAETWTDKKLF